MDEFVIARNPEPDSSLPYLLRLPLGSGGLVLKARDTWPRTAKVYCHAATGWPDEPEVVERVPVRSCLRRGAAIDLVLDRSRENRSQFVFTKARGRDLIFWQSARTARQARPNVSVPTARASGHVLEILVDSHERYPWTFASQQAVTRREALIAGDYAIRHDGRVVAAVERKSLSDLVTTIVGGKLRYLLAALADVPHAAVVVEDRYSAVFKLEHARPATIVDQVAEALVRFPTVPIHFAETRPLAQEWTYRFLGAALAHELEHDAATGHVAAIPTAGRLELPAAEGADAADGVDGLDGEGVVDDGAAAVPAAVVRAWARSVGLDVAERGRLAPEIRARYAREHHA